MLYKVLSMRKKTPKIAHSGVRTSARVRPPTKELFVIIPMHTMNRELIPGR